MKLSVAIITLNEKKNITRAIKSASFADEIIVIDSFSSDGTNELAASLGATVIQKEFSGFGEQKNLAANHCHGEWIFFMDADEEISDELKTNIQNVLNDSSEYSGFIVNRRTQYLGQWIYHGGWYPDYLLRLVKKDQAYYTNPQVHENLIFNNKNAKAKILKGHLNHYSFPTIGFQIQKNLKYATLGSKVIQPGSSASKMIFKPFFKFLECYILKKGFLDGYRGFIIAVNAAHSHFMKYSMNLMENEGNYD